MDDRMEHLERRIEALDRRSRWLGLTLLAVLGAALLLGAARPEAADSLRVGRLALVDGEGRERAVLAMREGDPLFMLIDAAGRDRLILRDDPEGSGLFILDSTGTTRIGAAQFAHGGGGFALHGPESKGAAVLYLQDDGWLRFFDDEGQVTHQVPPAD